MDFEPRLTILHQAGMLSEEDCRKVQDVIRFFSGEIRSDIDRRKRLRHDHAPVRCAGAHPPRRAGGAAGRGGLRRDQPGAYLPQGTGSNAGAGAEILPDLPEDEQKFLTMHIGVVLAQS